MTAAFTLLILLLVRHDKKNAQKYAIAEIKPPIRDKKRSVVGIVIRIAAVFLLMVLVGLFFAFAVQAAVADTLDSCCGEIQKIGAIG